jgi:hypothetical protein
VLAKCTPISEASEDITKKFLGPFDRPWKITKLLSASLYEFADTNGRTRGPFNKQALKPYLSPNSGEGRRKILSEVKSSQSCCEGENTVRSTV